MSIDAFAIPRDAPHPNEAYALLDFLLRPEIAARDARVARLVNRAEAGHEDALKRLWPAGVYDAARRERDRRRMGAFARREMRPVGKEDPVEMSAKPPNILIVMVDQLAPAFLPIHGHGRQGAASRSSGGGRRRLRERLLQQPALLAFARRRS